MYYFKYKPWAELQPGRWKIIVRMKKEAELGFRAWIFNVSALDLEDVRLEGL